MAANTPVAHVSAIQGTAFAKSEDGKMRQLKVGDPVFEGEILVAPPGSQVDLAMADGRQIALRDNEALTLDTEVVGDARADAADSALLAVGDEAQRIIQSINEGGNLDELLEETAAGEAAGGSDGGSTFVRLLRITEGVESAAYTFDETQSTQVGEEFVGVTDSQEVDVTAPGAPTITLLDGIDGQLNIAEIDAGVLAEVGLPTDALEGDILKVDTDGDGLPDITQKLTAADILAGLVTVLIPATDIPASGETLTVSATLTDPAGNVSLPAVDSSVIDSIAPIAVITLDQDITADDVINAAEAEQMIAITGTVGGDVQVGDTVTLSVNGKVFTGTVATGNTFSIAVPGADLVADADRTIEAMVTTTDSAGNIGTGTDSKGYGVDVTAPIAAITLDQNITADDVINAAEAEQMIAITGTVGGDVQVGDTVTLSVNGKVFTGTVATGNTFSIAVPGADLNADGDRIINASVITTDAAGNSVTATDKESYGVDVSGPILTVSAPDNTSDTTPMITGTSDLPVGSTIRLTVTDSTGAVQKLEATVQPGGSYSVVADTLPDGGYSVVARGTDAVGNGTTAKDAGSVNSAPLDTTPPNVEVVITDSVLNSGDRESAVTFTFTENPVGFTEADITATGGALSDLQVSATDPKVYTATFTAADDFTGPGTVSVAAGSYHDAAGNLGTAGSDTVAVDTTAPEAPVVVITEDANDDGVISNSELSGTVGVNVTLPAGAVAGDVLNVTGQAPITLTDAQITAGVLTFEYSRPADGAALSVTATLTDASGNVSPEGSDSATMGDTTAPEASNLNITYAENQFAGALLGAVALNDASGISSIVFSQTGTDISADGFYQVANDGTVTLTEAGTVSNVNNYEVGPNGGDYQLTVTDGVGNLSTVALALRESDVNEAPIAVNDGVNLATSTGIGGLFAEYYAYFDTASGSIPADGANLSSIQQALNFVGANQPDAVFLANNVDYGSVTDDLARDQRLQQFLGSDAASMSNDPINSTDGILHLSGQVQLAAGTYRFSVYADDGYQIVVDGKVVAQYDGNQSPTTRVGAEFTVSDGWHDIQIVYWDQAGNAEFRPSLGLVGGTYAPLSSYPTQHASPFVTSEDLALTIPVADILKNDTDPDNDTLSMTAVSNAKNGTVSLADGVVTFTPNANFSGIAQFDYTISDGHGGTNTATVYVDVTPINDAPVLAAETKTTLEDTTLTVSAANGLLATDSDVDGDKLTVTQFSVNFGGTTYTFAAGQTTPASSFGQLRINADGSYTFVPGANFNGALATVTYTVSDGTTTRTSTLDLSVTPVNDAPTSAAGSASISEGGTHVFTTADFAFHTVDSGDALANVIVTAAPATGSGTLTLNGVAVTAGQAVTAADIAAGKLVYTPGATNTEADFAFKVQDNGGTANGGQDTSGEYHFSLSVGRLNTSGTNSAETINGGSGDDVITADVGGSYLQTIPGVNYNIALIVDTSGSMQYNLAGAGTLHSDPLTQSAADYANSRMKLIKDALISLANQLAGHDGIVNISLIGFASDATLKVQVQDLTPANIDLLVNEIGTSQSTGLMALGGTNYQDAFIDATAWFNAQSSAGKGESNGYQNLTYFLTDGDPTYSNDAGGTGVANGAGNVTDYKDLSDAVSAFASLDAVSTV